MIPQCSFRPIRHKASRCRWLLQIMKATGIKGPQMKQITEKLLHWQLAHPDATKSDAEAYLTTIQG